MSNNLQVLLIVTLAVLWPALTPAQVSISTQPIQADERTALTPSDRMIGTGKNAARAACAQCHGMDGMRTGEGQPFLAGQRAIYLYRVLKAYQRGVRENESMQHASVFLNDEAMLSVAAYYASLSRTRPPESMPAPEEPGPLGDNPFTGIQDALGKCTKCHGETGNSSAPGMPSLTAQDPEYFVTSMQAYADGSRKHKLMQRLVGALDATTIGEMGLFYAVQDPMPTANLGEGDAEAGGKAAEPCAICHGADGNASGSDMPTLAGQDARYFVKATKAYQEGNRAHEPMSDAVDGLSDTEIIDMATFYASQKPLRRDVRAPFTTAQWVERCERCHGKDGNSTDPRFPMLAGQREEYLRQAMQSYSRGDRHESVMHAMSEPLSETDVEEIVNYYATREPKSVVYIQLPCNDSGVD